MSRLHAVTRSSSRCRIIPNLAPLRSGFTSPIDSHAPRSFRRIGKACHVALTTHDALRIGGF